MGPLANLISKNWCRSLIAVFSLALLVRLGFVLSLQDGFYFPDSVSYSEAAVNLLASGELGTGYNRPPGYAVLLAVIYALFGDGILATRVVESFIGAFAAVLITALGRRISGELVGIIAGFLWSLYPTAIFIVGLVYPTNLLTILLAGMFLWLIPPHQKELTPRRLFIAGLLAGVAALTVPVVLATALALGIWLLYWNTSRRILFAATLLLGTAIVVLPWMIRDYYVYGRLVLIEPRTTQHLPRMRTADEEIRNNKVQAIMNHPREFAIRFTREFSRFWELYPDRIAMDRPGFRDKMHQWDQRVVKDTVFNNTSNLIKAVSVLTTAPLFLFALIGSIGMAWQRDQWRQLSLIWATILSFALAYSVFVAKMRYRIPVEPYIMILAAQGMVATWTVISARFPYHGGVRVRRLDAAKEA